MVEINEVFLQDILDRLKRIETTIDEVQGDVIELKTNKSYVLKTLAIIGTILTVVVASTTAIAVAVIG